MWTENSLKKKYPEPAESVSLTEWLVLEDL